MTTATFIEKDNNWTDGSTTYWFDFESDVYGIVEGENAGVIDVDSMPLDYNEALLSRVQNACVVTDEMRAE